MASYINKRPLTDSEILAEIEKIMNGDNDIEAADTSEESCSEFEDYIEAEQMEVDSFSEDTNANGDENNVVESAINEAVNIEDESDDNIPLARFVEKSMIVHPKKSKLRGKNGHLWSTKLPSHSRRVSKRNLIHFIPGPKNEARELFQAKDCFLHFFSNRIIDQIVECTNQEIIRKSAKYKTKDLTVSETCREEILALIGLLILTAAMKNNHMNAKQLFNRTLSGCIYIATMSSNRFHFLLDCLRFDSKHTRKERIQIDPFAPVREIWDILIENCKSSYIPTSYITIDEQLLGFRGRCGFRMYIPNKPSKYGIKIVMTCDSSTKFMINAEPYLGKKTDAGGLPLANYYVKKMTETVHGSNRNITMDNWFTSVELAEELINHPYNLTIVGTIRKNKRHIPPEMLEVRNRRPGTSMFCFDKEKTLLSFMPKKNKTVLLLSTMHEGAVLNPNTNKPDIIHSYNATKSGVDTFDQICSNMSCNRKTRRWPMAIFYNMLNISAVNSYVIYSYNSYKIQKKPIPRRDFMLDLSNSLITPWLEIRKKCPSLRRPIREDIYTILNQDMSEDRPVAVEPKRTICSYCPNRKRRMTTTYCISCRRAICAEHRAKSCIQCATD